MPNRKLRPEQPPVTPQSLMGANEASGFVQPTNRTPEMKVTTFYQTVDQPQPDSTTLPPLPPQIRFRPLG